MDIHNNNNNNNNNNNDDDRAAKIANASHRRYTTGFCNWLAQQPNHRHMIRRNNNGEVVLIYDRLDAAAVKRYLGVYLRRRLRRHPSKKNVLSFHNAIKWGSRHANESLSRNYYRGIWQYTRYRYCCVKPFILPWIQMKIYFGFLRLAVLIARARRRVAKIVYKPGGVGYQRCREDFYNHVSISEKIHSNSSWVLYWEWDIAIFSDLDTWVSKRRIRQFDTQVSNKKYILINLVGLMS